LDLVVPILNLCPLFVEPVPEDLVLKSLLELVSIGVYRQQLFVRGEQLSESDKPGFTPETVQAVLDAGGTLPKGQALRCRVRYFSDGVILGSRSFVNEAFNRHRDYFSGKRTTGARPMRHADWAGMCTARRLRMSVLQVPTPT
jgi:hypothetical protein